MAKHGKRYLEAREKIDREKLYSPGEAVAAAQGDQGHQVRRVRRGPRPHRA